MAENSTSPAYESQTDFIPWTWHITPNLEHYTCPSTSSILGTFAVINILVSLLNLVFGNRRVVNFLSCRLFGNSRGRDTWWFMFLVPLATQLGANAFIAFTYKNASGYDQGFSIGDLVLFYTTRPRLGWIVLTALMDWGKEEWLHPMLRETPPTVDRNEENIKIRDEQNAHTHTRGLNTLFFRRGRQWYEESDRNGPQKQLERGYYEATAKGAIIAEIILLCMAAVYWGKTAHFGVTRGFYHAGHLKGSHANNARIMYGGALLSIIYVTCSVVFLAQMLWKELSPDETNDAPPILAFVIGSTTWVGSWLFWAGYIRLAGDLYCPSRLIESGGIWTSFSVIGTFFGGGI